MRGPKSHLSHGIRYWSTSPRDTFTFGNAAAKFGGSGRSCCFPFGMYRVCDTRSKFDCRPKRSPMGVHNSYRSPMFSVSFRDTFQSSCTYAANAFFCDEMKLVVEMVELSIWPRSADAIASPVLAATVGPSDEARVEGNAVWL